MRRLMLLLLSVLAVGVVGAAASASASAVELCKAESESGTFAVCLWLSSSELELLTEATLSVLQEEEPTHVLNIEFTVPIEVVCSEGTGEAGVFGELVMNGKLNFAGCVVEGAEGAKCEVETGKISANEIDAELSLATELESNVSVLRLDLLFAPEKAGGTFAEFTLLSKGTETCLSATNKGKVKGDQLCFFLDTGQLIEEDEVEHLFECPALGSELTFAGTPSSLQDEWSALMVSPVNDASWSIVEGK